MCINSVDNIYIIVYKELMDKTFKFDVIINEEDMCDREDEKNRLISLMKRQGRIVIYSIRRMGKTSLISVCSKKLKEADPKSFHLYCDLNEVASLNEVAGRFRSHYELALNEQLPIQSAKALINALLSRIKVSLPGDIQLSLERYTTGRPEEYLLSLFQELRKMSERCSLVIVIDEFQGIADLRDAQALLRRELKKLSKAAVILMGSNQRLLYKMFNNKNSPFFGFGEDLELKPIGVKDYLPYMNERLAKGNLAISEDVAEYLLEKMNGIPNYVNELGAWIVDTMSNSQLTKGHIDEALETAAKSKRGRYESALFGYSINQKKFIKAVAKSGRVRACTGKEMCEQTGLSATELARVKESLEEAPVLSRDTKNQLFVIDPFFRRFLEMM